MKKILILLLTTFLIVGCGHKKEETVTETSKLKITVTTSFLEDIVNTLVTDGVEVELVIPAGEDPHTYEAKPEDLNKIKNADVVFYHGLHFEGKMVEYLESLNGIDVSKDFDKSKLLSLEEDGENVIDPHFWFDIELYKVAVSTIANTLIEKLPEQKDLITTNLTTYHTKLDELKEYGIKTIGQIPKENRYLVTPHDAFGYFSRTFDIEVFAPQGVSTDSEVATSDLMETVDFIVKNKVKAIFAESTTDPARMEKLKESALSQGFEVKVVSGEGKELYSDSLAPKGHFGDNYLDMLKFNIDLITENLK